MSNDGVGTDPQAGGFSLSAISLAVAGVIPAPATSAAVFKSFIFEAATANTTVDIVVQRHPSLDMTFSGVATVQVVATNGVKSDGRDTALSETVT